MNKSNSLIGVCKYCGKVVKLNGLLSHIWRVHTPKGRAFKPTQGMIGWAKGLTKETDERIAKMAMNLSKTLTGKKRGPQSIKTRKILSIKRRDYLLKNPDKMSFAYYRKNGESLPEKLFRIELQKRKIKGWKQFYKISIYEYDFAFIKHKIDVEIDGHTHLTERVKRIDVRRDRFSRKKGWSVIRIKASEVLNNPKKTVDRVLSFIKRKYTALA